MSIQITEKQRQAMRKHAMPALRKIKMLDAEAIDIHKLDWSDLNSRAKEVKIEARAVSDKLIDGIDERTANEIQEAFDGLLAIFDALEAEKDTRNNIGSRQPRSHGGDLRRPVVNGEGRGVDDGRSIYRDVPEIESIGLRSHQRMARHIAERGVENFDLSPGQYLRAMVLGAKTEVEKRALSEGTDSAGGFTVPEILSAQVIDMVRAQSTVVRAGAITVPLESDTQHMAKVTTDPVPAWRNEAAAVAESDPTFGRVTFTPKSLAVLVKVSRELLEDSLNIETLLPQIITSAMAVELDRVSLFGTGTAPQPRGVVNFAGVQSVEHDAALASYASLIAARTKVKTANFDGVSAYIMHPRDEGTLAGLTASDGQPLNMPPAIAEVPMLTSTSVPADEGTGTNESTIVTGKFNQLMIGLRHGVTIQILRERFQDTGQYGFLAFMRADIAAQHENAFCKITGIIPAA